MHEESTSTAAQFKVGDVVEVRSIDEILATLDERGELDSLPFMPEMVQHCGRRFTVYKVATKVCDTVVGNAGLRTISHAVHLTGVRCDGSGHGGCQASCLIYWKTAWLRPARSGPRDPLTDGATHTPESLLVAARWTAVDSDEVRYRCQATELLRAAPDPLTARNLRQYIDDVRTGNVTAARSLTAFVIAMYNRLQDLSGRVLPRQLQFKGGRRWGALEGRVEGRTPAEATGLQPGEMVRVKSRAEVESTLNADLVNRGLGFDSEMARYCGNTARVLRRVDKIIDENTGAMLHMRNPCVVLAGVVCEGVYNRNCPRAITPYFREIWLERLGEVEASQAPGS